ncbi:MAG: NAD-binding protein [Sulfuritalea sp.]|nr:NAD-binding protein [Polynucleobacter sp.]MCF8187959.1 NAD-binding protein [Sulfuritalea sp.]
MLRVNTPVTKARCLGVIGLGTMGYGAAISAQRRGFSTVGLDISPANIKRFTDTGGKVASDIASLTAECDAFLILVVNAAQTEAVLFGDNGLAAHAKPGSVIIAAATVDPSLPPVWEKQLNDRGLHFIDGPVSGGAVKAEAGEMTVMASGKPEAFAVAHDVLEAYAGKVYRLGDHAGPGSTVKMVNQHLAGVHIAAACEAMALGIKAGADPHQLYEVICNSAGMSWMFQNRVPHILAGDYTPLSAVTIFVKDLGIVLDAAQKLTMALPLASSAHQLYLGASGAGFGQEDDSAVIKLYAQMTGIKLPEKADKS